MSQYGEQFDRLADRWAVLEQEHDKIHPQRDQCGGVGGCSLMFVAHRMEQDMIDLLETWRRRETR